MAIFLSNPVIPPPSEEDHAVRLADARPLRLTRAEFDALESPAGSGLYPSLKNRPLVIVTDGSSESGVIPGGDFAAPGVESDTGVKWIDGKFIYRMSFTAASVAPGTAGADLSTSVPALDSLVRMEGYGNLSASGSGGWVEIGGSGFSMTVRDDHRLTVVGPAGVTLYRVHVTIWYTK